MLRILAIVYLALLIPRMRYLPTMIGQPCPHHSSDSDH